jgi:hypothetical protein
MFLIRFRRPSPRWPKLLEDDVSYDSAQLAPLVASLRDLPRFGRALPTLGRQLVPTGVRMVVAGTALPRAHQRG